MRTGGLDNADSTPILFINWGKYGEYELVLPLLLLPLMPSGT